MSLGEERAIRSIVVVGAGIVGVSAAMSFIRALPRVRVSIIEVPPDPAALADRLTGSLPAIGAFHAMVGVDELDLVRGGAATHHLGTRFERWSADGEPWYHAFGEYGTAGGRAAFHQLWARAQRAKQALPYYRYSMAAVLAEAGKFVHPSDELNSPFSSFNYALRIDPDRYHAELVARAQTLPLSHMQAEIGGVQRTENGGVSALLLKDGHRVEADLFIDCAGPSAPVASALSERFEDWGESLPCDRLLLGSSKAGQFSSSDLAAATSVGWRWASPLGGRQMVGLAYASSVTGEARARRVLASEAGVEEAEAVAIRTGRRPEPWTHNVLAVGDAAIAVDALQGVNLHLAQSAIRRALELLPGRDCHPLELREYNRRTKQETRRVRDFLALHYLRSGRSKGELWQALAARSLPNSLAHSVEQFEARGRLPFYEEESFDKQSWLAVLIGIGLLPRQVDPIAAALREDEAAAWMQRMADGITQEAARVPPYRDYLGRMLQPPTRRG